MAHRRSRHSGDGPILGAAVMEEVERAAGKAGTVEAWAALAVAQGTILAEAMIRKFCITGTSSAKRLLMVKRRTEEVRIETRVP